jgi:hypothetical protein
MEHSRRTVLATVGSAAVTGAAGCAGIRSDIESDLGVRPVSRGSWSTVNDAVAVTGQPTTADRIPSAWGTVTHTPEETQNRIDWDAVGYRASSGPPELADFAVDRHFVIITVGVLPYGYSLRGQNPNRSDLYFNGETVRYEATSYRAFGSGDEPPPSEHIYSYSIRLWDRQRAEKPDRIEVNYNE